MTSKPKPNNVSSSTATSPRKLVFFHIVFLVMFLIFGLGIVRDGYRAIVHKSYSLNYTETTRIANTAWSEDKSAQFKGQEAVIFGTGFMATGTMLLVWSSGLVFSLLSRVKLAVPMITYRIIGYLSLATMVVASLMMFPVWHIHTLPFYLVIAAFTLALTLPIRAALRKKVFPAVVISIIVVGLTEFPSFPLFAGLFVSLAAGGNILFLWPNLATHLAPSPRKTKE